MWLKLSRVATALRTLKQRLDLDSSADLRTMTRTARETGKVENFHNSFAKMFARQGSSSSFVMSEITHCKLARDITFEKLCNFVNLFVFIITNKHSTYFELVVT